MPSQSQLKTVFINSSNGEIVSEINGHLYDAKEGQIIKFQTTSATNQFFDFEVVEVESDLVNLYGLKVTRNIRVFEMQNL